MSLDTADFPLVWMRQNGRDTRGRTGRIQRAAGARRTFVLMTDRSVGDEEQEHDRDARTRVALWKRDNREALKLWVKGMIMLEPDDAKRAAAEEFAEYGAKFWGYPVLVAADEAAGRVLAQTLLLK